MSLAPLDRFNRLNDPSGKSWEDLSTKLKAGRGGINPKPPSAAAAARQGSRQQNNQNGNQLAHQLENEAEAESKNLDKVLEPPASAKPAVRLFNPKWHGDQGVFNEKMRVSVEAELPPESSHITRVIITANAILPNGKLDPDRIPQNAIEFELFSDGKNRAPA